MAKTMTQETAKTLWYRQHPANGDLVFATPNEALYIDGLHKALNSETWGEFRRRIPEDQYAEILERQYEYLGEPTEVPSDEDRFNACDVPGVADGDYPPWLQQGMERNLPKEIIDKYGKWKSTMLNGSYLAISPACEDEVVASLRKLGFTVERRGDLRFW